MPIQLLDPEATSSTGALVGPYLVIREIADRALWKLQLASTLGDHQGSAGVADKLVRTIALPEDLPSDDYQRILEAITDSRRVVHDWALGVVDVIAANGSIALVHDVVAGSLLHSVYQSMTAAGRSIPTEIAVRIALDAAAGIERGRELCDVEGIAWQPGGTSMHSLYLCRDGRTRTLDASVMATLARLPFLRSSWRQSFVAAPEMLDECRAPDDRTDVFEIGTLLVELIAGREMDAGSMAPVGIVIPIVPAGIEAPPALVQVMRRALAIDPAKRQSTLQEFVVELAMGAEKIATHAQVAEFALAHLVIDSTLRTSVIAARPADCSPVSAETPAGGDSSATSCEDDATLDPDEVTRPSGVVRAGAPNHLGAPPPRYPSPFEIEVGLAARSSVSSGAAQLLMNPVGSSEPVEVGSEEELPVSVEVADSEPRASGQANESNDVDVSDSMDDIGFSLRRRRFAWPATNATLLLGVATAMLAAAIVAIVVHPGPEAQSAVVVVSAQPTVRVVAVPATPDATVAATSPEQPAVVSSRPSPAVAKRSAAASAKTRTGERSAARKSSKTRQGPGLYIPDNP